MDFYIEKRNAWIRTNTHTMVLQRDPEFDLFQNDESGELITNLRVWLADYSKKGPNPKAYLGSLCCCAKETDTHALLRILRRMKSCVEETGTSSRFMRRKLISLLREQLPSPPTRQEEKEWRTTTRKSLQRRN